MNLSVAYLWCGQPNNVCYEQYLVNNTFPSSLKILSLRSQVNLEPIDFLDLNKITERLDQTNN
uniref:Uncharacterized protein n=1 Tax=Arundo donax TaxID=35708 RepID=A0A0A9E0K9_ARUDO